jgi:hypothetical protein
MSLGMLQLLTKNGKKTNLPTIAAYEIIKLEGTLNDNIITYILPYKGDIIVQYHLNIESKYIKNYKIIAYGNIIDKKENLFYSDKTIPFMQLDLVPIMLLKLDNRYTSVTIEIALNYLPNTLPSLYCNYGFYDINGRRDIVDNFDHMFV